MEKNRTLIKILALEGCNCSKNGCPNFIVAIQLDSDFYIAHTTNDCSMNYNLEHFKDHWIEVEWYWKNGKMFLLRQF